MPGFLETTALQIVDFTGGFTDDPASAKPNQYTVCDNWEHTTDGKLRVRQGRELLAGHVTAYLTAPYTASNLRDPISFHNRRSLLAASGTTMYAFPETGFAAWTAIPTYGSATGYLGTFQTYSIWENQLFVASYSTAENTAGKRPVKIYWDGTANAWRAVSAGLPAVDTPQNYIDSTVLDECIALANDIRVNIKRHFTDADGDDKHPTNDTVSNALVSASDCTDEATMFALTGTMLQAFKLHNEDVFKHTPVYHADTINNLDNAAFNKSIEFTLTAVDTPTTLKEAADRLNDLKWKFIYHDYPAATWHAGELSTDLPTVADVSAVTEGPTMSRPLTKIATVAMQLALAYNAHESDAALHTATTGISATMVTLQTTLRTITQQVQEVAYLIDIHDQDAEINGPLHGNVEYSDHTMVGVDSALGERRVYAAFDSIKLNAATLLSLREFLAIQVELFNAHDNDADAGGAHTGGNLGEQRVDLNNFPEVGDYVYAFHWYREYTAEDAPFNDGSGELHADAGPVLLVEYADAPEPNIDPNTISNIPTIDNGTSAWDVTTTTKMRIYRTERNGSTLYLLTTLDYGVSSYIDSTSDADLVDGEVIYTSGGVVDNDPPPRADCLHICNDTGYYGGIRDTVGEFELNVIRVSIQGDPDSCPEDFTVELPLPVRAITSTKGIPIAFTERGFYRLEGSYDELGQGAVIASPISESIGLMARRSCVQVEGGVVFWSFDGIYFTDGYQVAPLTRNWKNKFRVDTTLVAASNPTGWRDYVTGYYDSDFKKVYWNYGPEEGVSTFYMRKVLVMDFNFGVKDDMPVAIWHSNYADGFVSQDWRVTGFCRSDAYPDGPNSFMVTDGCGFLFSHGTGILSEAVLPVTYDDNMNLSVAADSWTNTGYRPDYVSPMFNFGTDRSRKWVPRVSVVFKPDTDVSLYIKSRTDEDTSGSTSPENKLAMINWDKPSSFTGYHEETRRMYAGGFRCMKRQVRFERPDTVILYEGLTNATTATISGGTTVTFNEAVDMNFNNCWLVFGTDPQETTARRRVTARGGTTATLSASYTDGVYTNWYLVGTPQNQFFALESYLVHYAYVGASIQSSGDDNLS